MISVSDILATKMSGSIDLHVSSIKINVACATKINAINAINCMNKMPVILSKP
jgi:hypothetical protein